MRRELKGDRLIEVGKEVGWDTDAMSLIYAANLEGSPEQCSSTHAIEQLPQGSITCAQVGIG